MCVCSTQIFEGYLFICNRLDDFRTSYEHVSSFVNHNDKVSNCRRVNSTASTRTHDDTNLWYNSTCSNISKENFSIRTKACYALLNTGASTIVQTDYWAAGLQCHVQDFANFETVHLTKAASIYSEILCECENFSPVNGSMPSYYSVTGNYILVHVKISASMLYKRINFLERPFIE